MGNSNHRGVGEDDGAATVGNRTLVGGRVVEVADEEVAGRNLEGVDGHHVTVIQCKTRFVVFLDITSLPCRVFFQVNNHEEEH